MSIESEFEVLDSLSCRLIELGSSEDLHAAIRLQQLKLTHLRKQQESYLSRERRMVVEKTPATEDDMSQDTINGYGQQYLPGYPPKRKKVASHARGK